MSSGLTQVIGLLLLTVVVLPCAFFTLLAFLDRMERSLSAAPTSVYPAAAPTSVNQAAAPTSVHPAVVAVVIPSADPEDDDGQTAEILALPLPTLATDTAAAI